MSDPLTKDYRGVPENELVVTFMADLRERITALEAENRALREWAAARDVVRALETEERPNWKQLQAADQVERDRRQRLAAEHGLPLPGAGEPI